MAADHRTDNKHPTSGIRLWAPWHWPVWLGLAVLRLINLLPWRLQMAMGRAFGRFAGTLMRSRRRIVARNLELCFPEWSATARQQLMQAHFSSLGAGLLEPGLAWWTPEHRLPPVTVSGREHLDAAQGPGRGVILLSPHFTTLELSGRVILNNMHGTMRPMYRRMDHPVLEHVFMHHRRRLYGVAIPRDRIRDLIRLLRRGETVWYAPDQSYRGAQSAMVPFFGIEVPTNTATARIAALTGAAVVPCCLQRLPDGYHLHIGPALEHFPGEDEITATQRVNEIIEQQIRLCPEHYWWVHRRFKKRPKGYRNLYEEV